MRKAVETNHGVLLDGQKRIESSVSDFRTEVAKAYVDKISHKDLEGRVKSVEEKSVGIEKEVGDLSGYLGWIVKSIIGIFMVGVSGLLFAKGGGHLP